ncbi:UNVERIFIED_ORG: hypothetical protein QE434_002431 [Rhizobium sp. SORGH_AS 755]|nr:hypothetical protein [Rhizobium sp. SORGH_AS_0755]
MNLKPDTGLVYQAVCFGVLLPKIRRSLGAGALTETINHFWSLTHSGGIGTA